MIIFTGILSVAFLQRTLGGREWIGIFFVIIGLGIVGSLDFFSNDIIGGTKSRNNIITGDLLIVVAQIIWSVQMVYEERFVARMEIPALQAVGWEGFFGFSVLSLLLIPMYYIHVGEPFNHNAHKTIEDFIDAMIQIKNCWQIIGAFGGIIVSIAFYNFSGISITKELSATTRMVLDSVSTLVIWAVSLCVGWQQFHWLHLVGFTSLLFGMCLYNNVIVNQLYHGMRNIYHRRIYDELQAEVIVNNITE